MAYLLIVEDDKQIRSFLVEGFKQLGYSVEQADNVLDANMYIDTASIEIAIVDIMLGGSSIDGIAMLKTWRKKEITIPVLFLSARDRVEDRVAGFNAGADDYVCKPFSFLELSLRVRSLLRRSGVVNNGVVLRYEDLQLNLPKRTVTRGDIEIELQRREFLLLQYLMENAELILGKNMILERVWGYDFDPKTNVVDVLVSRLRAKIDKKFKTSLIHNSRGVGYVLKKA